MSDLEVWMNRWYNAKVLSSEVPAAVSAAFAAAAAGAPELLDAAREEIKAFNSIVPDPDTLGSRCFASAVKRDWLVAMLENAG